MQILKTLIIVSLLQIFSSDSILAQWQSSSTIVQLNNNNRIKAVGISDVEEGLSLGKLFVRGNSAHFVNGNLISFGANTEMASSHTLLQLNASAFPSGNPTILEGLREGSSEAFHIDYNGNLRLRGALRLFHAGGTGAAIRVNGQEALWFNGTEFSWGFSGTWNRFADPISIGAAGQPATGIGLHIGESKDIRLIGNDVKQIQFRNNANTASLSEISSGLNFLRIQDLTQVFLRAGSTDLITLHGQARRIDIADELDMAATAKIQWGSSHGNPTAFIVYESDDLGMVNTDANKGLHFITNSGDIDFSDGTFKARFRDGDFTIDQTLETLDNISSGVVLTANRKEAISYDGSSFKWGDGASWNAFSDPISIGGSSAPDNGVGLKIEDAKDLQFSGNGDKRIQFINGSNQLRSEIYATEGLLSIQNSTVNDSIVISTNSGNISLTDGNNTVTYSNGNFGIGYSTPTYPLHVNGDVGVDGEFYALSDKRLKKDITPLHPERMDQIMAIQPVKFKWKDKLKQDYTIGVVAQEIELLFPEAVKTDENGIKRVQYDVFGVLAIEAIKQLKTDLDKQQKLLESHNDILDDILSQLNNSSDYGNKSAQE